MTHLNDDTPLDGLLTTIAGISGRVFREDSHVCRQKFVEGRHSMDKAESHNYAPTYDVIGSALDGAKDHSGVITADALHSQLNTLTGADWLAASKIYTKQKAGADGFYIEDNAGQVTLHNDVRQLSSVANESVNHVWVNYMKSDYEKLKGAIVGIPLATSGLMGIGALAEVGTWAAGAAALGEGALIGAAVVPVVGAIVAGSDYCKSAQEKGDAQSELNQNRTLKFFASTR